MKSTAVFLLVALCVIVCIGCTQKAHMRQVKQRFDRVDVEAMQLWAIHILEDETIVDHCDVSIESLPGATELGVLDARILRNLPEADPHVVIRLGGGHYRTFVFVGDKGLSLPPRRYGLREEYADGIWIDISSR